LTTAHDGPEDDKAMPLLDHLIELRKRLIYAIVGFLLVFFVTFYFAKPIFSFLIQPALADGYKVIVLDIFEFFFVTVKLAAFVSLIVGFPLIAVQIWLFVAPGLYRHERRAFVPFLVATPFMFYAGCALMYYVVLPYVINFMLTQYAPPDIEKTLRSSDYLERILQLVFAFGFAFEVPVLLTLLVQVGIATTEGLRSKRRYAIVVAFVVAAVLAPPDVISQVALAIPLIAFYELSILIGRVIEKKRSQADKKAEEEEARVEAEEAKAQAADTEATKTEAEKPAGS
jgi:sec-independent protein translocase protein TatC